MSLPLATTAQAMLSPLDARRAWDMGDFIDRIAASCGRNPKGENTEECLSAEHEHAVPRQRQTPISYRETPETNYE